MAEAMNQPGQAFGQAEETGESPNRRAWLRFRDNRPAMVASVFLLGLIVLALAWPLISSQGDVHSEAQFAAPSAGHWFGTDVHGRDLFGRVLAGARISLIVGLVGALVSLVIGVLWGATAGLLGGRWDNLMMRTVDVLYSLPSIIFVIVIITTLEGVLQGWLQSWLGSGSSETARMLLLYAGLGAVSWLTMARIVRGQVLALRERQFVEAARSLGLGTWVILWRHILPNVVGVVIVYLTLTLPAVVMYESFLSYLGLGIQPPRASLGSLIAEGAAQIKPDTSLLVDDRVPGRLPCGVVDGTQLSRRWIPRCVRPQGGQGSLNGQALGQAFFWGSPRKEKWSGRRDSNSRPPDPEPGALPSCATSRPKGRGVYRAWGHLANGFSQLRVRRFLRCRPAVIDPGR